MVCKPLVWTGMSCITVVDLVEFEILIMFDRFAIVQRVKCVWILTLL